MVTMFILAESIVQFSKNPFPDNPGLHLSANFQIRHATLNQPEPLHAKNLLLDNPGLHSA